MRFVSVRELRTKSADVWRELGQERELVITSNGKPIAIVSATDEQTFEQSLAEIRQARALRAVKQLQERSAASGRDKMSAKDIDGEIAAARKGRRR
jgi:antitoxin (DNA-binding transcriptional repressor) of toxin-antitoxin stability system